MRLNNDRLVNQLEPTFRLADRFDREGPNRRWPGDLQSDVHSQPLVDQADRSNIAEVKPCAKLAERLPTRITEKAIVGTGWRVGKIEFDTKMEGPVGWQTLRMHLS